ncbi:hypothetical protein ADUPG1_009120 [Aduncisulcus paluster]|uniref:Tetratricopeptide repeat protein 29 n=1 Tax=Aduncisulcus paluster TaxID=2918883 RepID=A0ABQ5KVP0_9EUKA|nr:hypothetical protein ADUPG1_009120 [Aduncisulcus paluster]
MLAASNYLLKEGAVDGFILFFRFIHFKQPNFEITQLDDISHLKDAPNTPMHIPLDDLNLFAQKLVEAENAWPSCEDVYSSYVSISHLFSGEITPHAVLIETPFSPETSSDIVVAGNHEKPIPACVFFADKALQSVLALDGSNQLKTLAYHRLGLELQRVGFTRRACLAFEKAIEFAAQTDIKGVDNPSKDEEEELKFGEKAALPGSDRLFVLSASHIRGIKRVLARLLYEEEELKFGEKAALPGSDRLFVLSASHIRGIKRVLARLLCSLAEEVISQSDPSILKTITPAHFDELGPDEEIEGKRRSKTPKDKDEPKPSPNALTLDDLEKTVDLHARDGTDSLAKIPASPTTSGMPVSGLTVLSTVEIDDPKTTVFTQRSILLRSVSCYTRASELMIQIAPTDYSLSASIHRSLCLLYQRLNLYSHALASAEHQLEIAVEIEDKDKQCDALASLSGIHRIMNNKEKAGEYLEKLYGITHKGDELSDLQRARAADFLGELYAKAGRSVQSVVLFKEFFELAFKGGDEGLDTARVKLGVARGTKEVEAVFKKVVGDKSAKVSGGGKKSASAKLGIANPQNSLADFMDWRSGKLSSTRVFDQK